MSECKCLLPEMGHNTGCMVALEALLAVVDDGAATFTMGPRYLSRVRLTRRERRWWKERSHRGRRRGWARTDAPRAPCARTKWRAGRYRVMKARLESEYGSALTERMITEMTMRYSGPVS